MIKIIKQGNIPDTDIKTFECWHCGAKFTGDRRNYSVDISCDGESTFYRLICPCCGTKCTVVEKRERG